MNEETRHWTANFDWKNPDYAMVFHRRSKMLVRIRQDLDRWLPSLKIHYREQPWTFIIDWGCTYDPRNIEIGLPALVPFILFERQVEWIKWVIESWKARRNGVNPKTRESGVSWLAMATACTLGLHYDGFSCGVGSRKEEYVDLRGSPKSLLWKARKFMTMLPIEFRGGYDESKHSPHMRLLIPDTESMITGEAGDEIGRGDRQSIYIVDEAAHLEHPETTDAALASTTNCRIDVSTANGTDNPFYRKCTTWPAARIFRMHWRQDPRKDEEWYARQAAELDPVILAQEIDIDFAASIIGALIPSAWIQASVDACRVLDIRPTGEAAAGLDVADQGEDLCALVGGKGIEISCAEEWSGRGDDVYGTVVRAFDLCDEYQFRRLRYDADGIGAGVRGDARILNEQRGPGRHIPVHAFRGSASVYDPTGELVAGRKNEDYFDNLKAQAWWALRLRFRATYRAVVLKKEDWKVDDLISIEPNIAYREKLIAELGQPTYALTKTGKIAIDKKPPGTRSPNLADACMIRFAPVDLGLAIIATTAAEYAAAVAKLRALPGGRRLTPLNLRGRLTT